MTNIVSDQSGFTGSEQNSWNYFPTSCRDPWIFVRRGQSQSDKKKLWQRFFFCFFLVGLFYGSQMVNFKEIYHFSRFQRGSNIFQGGGGGGGQLFQGGGGSICLFSIETPITCDFPGGGGSAGPPVPLSGIALEHAKSWETEKPANMNTDNVDPDNVN